MNSIRRSNRFDKRQLVTVVLRNGGKAGCGVTLEGKEPPIIASLSKKYMLYTYKHVHTYTHAHTVRKATKPLTFVSANVDIERYCYFLDYAVVTSPNVLFFVCTGGEALTSGLREGDKLLEVNGASVRELSNEQVSVMLREAPEVVTIVVHSIKPPVTPQGTLLYISFLS